MRSLLLLALGTALAGPLCAQAAPFARTVELVLQARAVATGPGATLTGVSAVLALPPDLERQTIENLRFDPPPAEILALRGGQRVARWRVDRLMPGDTLRVSWRAEVTLQEVRHVLPTTADDLLPARWPRTKASALSLGQEQDPGDPLLDALAQGIAQRAKAPRALLQSVVDEVALALEYELDGRWDSPGAVLRAGRGSCSEYAFLFVALARRVGLPARTVGGTVFRGNGDEAACDRIQHRWAEAWLPSSGWIPVDVSAVDGEPTAVPPFGLGILGARTLIISQGSHRELLGRHAIGRAVAEQSHGARLDTELVAHWHAVEPAPPTASAR